MFGGGKKIKLSDATYEKVRVAAEILGCSIEEFAEKELQAACAKTMAKTGSKNVSQKEIDDIANSMKGLGYIE